MCWVYSFLRRVYHLSINAKDEQSIVLPPCPRCRATMDLKLLEDFASRHINDDGRLYYCNNPICPLMRGSESIDCYPFHGITPCSTVADTSNRLELQLLFACWMFLIYLARQRLLVLLLLVIVAVIVAMAVASITHCSLYREVSFNLFWVDQVLIWNNYAIDQVTFSQDNSKCRIETYSRSSFPCWKNITRIYTIETHCT